MITYRANLKSFAPEQSTIEKISINNLKKTIRVLKSKKLPNAYFYIVGKQNIKECLNKNFFDSIKED